MVCDRAGVGVYTWDRTDDKMSEAAEEQMEALHKNLLINMQEVKSEKGERSPAVQETRICRSFQVSSQKGGIIN